MMAAIGPRPMPNKFMTANQAEYSIQMMSRTLGVSSSGFYAYHSRPPSARQVADDALTGRISTIHEASKQIYGAPRIHAELAEDGIQVGRKRIARLMKGEPSVRETMANDDVQRTEPASVFQSIRHEV